jgi:hypothetical protein
MGSRVISLFFLQHLKINHNQPDHIPPFPRWIEDGLVIGICNETGPPEIQRSGGFVEENVGFREGQN